MSLLSLLQNLLAVVPVVGALLLLRAIDVPRARRHQQFVLPAVAVVFAIAALVVLYRFNEWLDALLAWVFSVLPFLQWLYQARWMYVIENVAIVLVFVAVKLAYRQVAARVFTGDRFPASVVVEQLYEYDASSGRWYVRERLSQVRLFYGILYAVSLAVTAVLLLAMGLQPAWPGFAAIAFPAVAVLVLGEMYSSIDGVTQREASDLIAGERDHASRRSNYAALREVFRDAFGEHVIDEGVDMSNPRSLSASAALRELATSESGTQRLFADFFSRAAESGLRVDENLLHASLGVLRGRSVVISTPFYTDLTEYLALPMYIRQLRGGRTLVVTGRDSGATDLVRWLSDGLERITGVPDLWDVRLLSEEPDDGLDVGVLRSADLHNLRLLAANDAFFHEVETVLVIEPSRLLATGQLGLGIVVSRLSQGEAPVYVAVDRNHDGLVDALSHLLKVSLVDVVATQQPTGASSEMVWGAEGAHLAGRILPGVARYLGIGTELAALALKYHVSEVEWVGGDRFPVTDMSWIAGQYFGRINAFAELEMSQRALSGALRAEANPLGITRAQRRFLVVEDEFSNVYETLRLFASRSTESGFIHLISEDYLLRDYMVGNRELFSADPKAIPSIVADFARTTRNTVLRLVLLLSAFPVAESTIARELELAGWSAPHEDSPTGAVESPVVQLLGALVRRYLAVDDARLVPQPRRRDRSGEGDPDAVDEPAYRLGAGSGLDQVVRELGSAYFLVEDETEGRDYIGGCLYGHVHQTVLPGQFLTVGGKYYEVLTVGGEDSPAEVVLRRAAEHISGRRAYRPLRSFEILDVRRMEHAAPRVASESVVVERVAVTMTVQSEGYLESEGRADLGSARRVTVPDLPLRRYVEKDALRIAMPGASAEVRRTVAVLLNELFVTVFPSGHPFVVALAPDPDGALGDLLPSLRVDDDEAVYVVEDSSVDLGLVIAVERNWRRMLEIITDYLSWLSAPPADDEPAQGSPAVFPDESPEDAAERVRRAEEPEAEQPRRSWWRRVLARVAGWFRRRPARPAPSDEEFEPVPDQEPELELEPDQESRPEPEPDPDPVPEEESAPEAASGDGAAQHMTSEGGEQDDEQERLP